jgi:nucleotide-binding universal stress UspA family protein
MIKDARGKIEKRYISQLDGFDNYGIEIWEGIPYVEILKFARQKNCDLIVLAHHTKIIKSSLKAQNKDFGSKSRRSRVLTRRHTQVCRGLKMRLQRRGWAKRLF